MSKSTTEELEIEQRQVGEKVKLTLTLDSASTKDLGDGVLEAVVTTSAEDRHKEQIITSGIDTKRYMDNPVVLYGHDYFGLPIGKTIKLIEQKNKMKARFQLAVEEYPFAKTVYGMVKAGYLNAVSIGGIVRKWSEDYRTILEMEMVEFSIVSIPANPDAMITSRSFEDAVGKSIDEVAKEFEDFNRATMLDKVKGMPQDEVSSAIKVLESLVATLKESAQAASTVRDEPKETRRIKHITLRDAAKAAATQSQRVIKTIKLKSKE